MNLSMISRHFALMRPDCFSVGSLMENAALNAGRRHGIEGTRLTLLFLALVISMFCIIGVTTANANIYRYIDGNNKEHITNDLNQVPEEYREQFYDKSEPLKSQAVLNAEKELEEARIQAAANALRDIEQSRPILHKIYAFADKYDARLALTIIVALFFLVIAFIFVGYYCGFIISPQPPRRSHAFDKIVNQPVKKMGVNADNAQLGASDVIPDEAVPNEHLLKRLAAVADFSIAYEVCEKLYATDNRRPDHAPLTLFKITFLLFLYDLTDEQAMEQLQTQHAFKWFVGLNLSNKPPDIRSMFKFRSILGADKFQNLFNEIVDKARTNGFMNEKLRLLSKQQMDKRKELFVLKNEFELLLNSDLA